MTPEVPESGGPQSSAALRTGALNLMSAADRPGSGRLTPPAP